MKLSELDISEFIAILREGLGYNEMLSYSDACNKYNISRDHLQYQIRAGRIKSIHKHGKGYILKSDIDRLLQCKLLIHKSIKS